MLRRHKFFASLPVTLLLVARLATTSQILELTETLQVKSNFDTCTRMSGDKIVCICNETSCDQLSFDWPTRSRDARIVETTRSGLRFKSRTLFVDQDDASKVPQSLSTIEVDLNSEHQTIMGFGGAFTDAATINIANLSKSLANKLLESYFGPNGAQYTIGRVPIAGSDFSTRAYSYDDTNNTDYDLLEWKLAEEDLKYKIPAIKQAMELVAQNGDQFKLFASPWSPPTWMKTNHSFKRGHLINDDKVYKAYADYLVKFYDAYKEHGITFWGATVQNEPIASYLPFYFFNSLEMNREETRKFIVEFLGPALEKKGYTKDKFKLMIGDDSLLFVNQQVSGLLDDEQIRKYVSGLAFHWYTSGLVAPYSSLSKLVKETGDKVEFVIMSEACNGAMTLWNKHVDLGNWDRGEAYAVDIIEDINRGTSAWIDWNLALDEQGGPNWAGNFVDSPIIVNKEKNEFYKQPMYYALAHFGRFFRPGSNRVGSQLLNPAYFEKTMISAVHNKPSGHVIINILNKSTNDRTLALNVKLPTDSNTRQESIVLSPFLIQGKSINSVIIKL